MPGAFDDLAPAASGAFDDLPSESADHPAAVAAAGGKAPAAGFRDASSPAGAFDDLPQAQDEKFSTAGAMAYGAGAAIPFSDRATAAFEAATGWGDQGGYAANKERIDRAREQAYQQHPWAYVGGELATAALPVGPAMRGVTWAERAASGAKIGAGYGALFGASSAKDLTKPEEALPEVAKGALGGAVTGAALGVAPAAISGAVKKGFPEHLDKLAKIFAPETRGPLAQEAASIIREEGGIAAREQAQIFEQMGAHRDAQNLIQSQWQATDKVAGDGTRYTAAARQFSDYMDGVGARPQNETIAKLADTLKPIYLRIRGRVEDLYAGDPNPPKFLENYFPQRYSQEGITRSPYPKQEGLVATAGKGGTTGFLKKREKHAATSEAIDAGAKFTTHDPVALTYQYIVNAEKYLSTRGAWRRFEEAGHVHYFVSGDKNIPNGWSPFKEGQLKQKHGGGILQQAYGPDEIVTLWDRWNSQLSDAFIGQVIRGTRKMNSVMTAWELAFNGYHASVMTMESMVNEAARAVMQLATPGMRGKAALTLAQAPFAPFKYAFLGGQGAKIYVGRPAYSSKLLEAAGWHEQTPHAEDLVKLLAQAGARGATGGGQRSLDLAMPGHGPLFRTQWRGVTHALKLTGDAVLGRGEARQVVSGGLNRLRAQAATEFRQHPIKTPLSIPFRAFFKVVDTISATLFDEFIPRLKNGAMMAQLGDWLKANPLATESQKLFAARRIVDSIDNRFGEMVHDNIFWTRSAKESLMASMLSYSWNMGTAREVGGGLFEIPRTIAGGKSLSLQGGTDTSFKAAYSLALPFVWGMFASIYQYSRTGEAPKNLQDVINPRTGGTDPKTGEHERLATFGYMKDIAELYQKVMMEHDFVGFLTNKANPGLTASTEIISVLHGMGGSDWRNDPFTHPNLGLPLPYDVAQQMGQLLEVFAEEHAPISYKNLAEKPRGTHISDPERLLGMREASTFRVDPERAVRTKQSVIDRRWATKQKHEAKQRSLHEDDGLGRHEW